MSPATNRASVFVLLGAAGDLARRLVVPALYALYREGGLPAGFRVVGVDRLELDPAALSERLRGGCAEFGVAPDDDTWNGFTAGLDYRQLNLKNPDDYHALAEILPNDDTQRIFYLATPSFLFAPAAAGLGGAGLLEDRANTRVVVEKPIGHDLQSFRDIDAALKRWLEESQLYRIDHYLGKETVQNILALRFANPLFEPIWDRRYIDHVTITVAETLGVEHRGGYYESAGALRDMVQNHLMQLLCLIAMEPPASFSADRLRDRKMDVMRALRPIPPDAISDHCARGQYGGGWIQGDKAIGYRQEEGVAPNSNVETFAALKLFVDNWRWQDV
ncbi:MAG: glucose-6-phosphate dehydrogenase (NADP(+)), partial [Chromatiales bacterium]|nr:glucose-6-phosphate dehydrogenase (NADP(+)) [Chromatiales bacterium]